MIDIPVPQTESIYYYQITSAIGHNESIKSATLQHKFTDGISKFKFNFEKDDNDGFISDADKLIKEVDEFKDLKPGTWTK